MVEKLKQLDKEFVLNHRVAIKLSVENRFESSA